MSTIGERLREDPRIEEAKKLLQATVADYQKEIIGVRAPLAEKKVKYQQLLDEFAECRGGKLYYSYLGSGIGKGSLVELLDGSIKYDFICGIGPHYWGHSSPDLLRTSIDAALNDVVMEGNLQQNSEALELCQLLTNASGLDHCFLTSSGAMANENALKIAFQYRQPASRILAFERCFMGRTLALSNITDKPAYRQGIPHTVQVDYIPFFDPKNPEESTKRTLNVLKKHLARHPGKHAVMCMELIQGEGGFHPGSKDFFHQIIALLKEHDILILADEIQTFGRTPSLFAFQYFGLEEFVDIVTIGKLSQICATLFLEKIKPKPGLLSQTFTASSAAIFAALHIIGHLLNNDYFGPDGRIMQIHRKFASNLEGLAKRHPEWVRGPFGIGAMIVFTPFDGDAKKVISFAHRLFENGVITFIAGADPTRLRFLPPAGVVTDQEIDAVTQIIEQTLKQETG